MLIVAVAAGVLLAVGVLLVVLELAAGRDDPAASVRRSAEARAALRRITGR